MSEPIPRRRVLIGGLAVAGVAGVAGVGAIRLFDDDSADGAAPVSDDEAVRFVAELALVADPTIQTDADAAATPRSAVELDTAVMGDFANGRTVDVDGWLISRTEAVLAVQRSQSGAG